MDPQTSISKPHANGNNGLVLRDGALAEYPFARDSALMEYLAGPPKDARTMRDYLKILFRQKAVILATVFAVLATVYVGLKLRTPVYEARVKMLILAEKQVESPYYRDLEGSFKTELAQTQSEIVKANPVLERAVKALKLDERPLDYEKEFASPMKGMVIDARMKMLQQKIQSPEQEKFMRFKVALESLKKAVKVKPVANTNLFTISVRDYSPIAAATIANTISRYYVIFDLEQQLAELSIKYGEKHLAVAQLRDNIERLQGEMGDTPHSYIDAMGPASVKVLEQASMPTDPVGPPKPLVGLAALLMSLILGTVLAFTFEAMDPTFRSPEDVGKALNVPFLGSIPKRRFGSRILMKEPMIPTRYAESFQHLADQMHIVMKSNGLQSVLVTSSRRAEGASTVAVNVANALSRNLGHRVLLIDANLRSPSVHRIYKLPNQLGLSDVLEGRTTLETAVWETSPTLSVLPAGKSKANPIAILDSVEMAELMRRAREKYGLVIVDCSSLKGHKDTEVLSTLCDGVVIVIEADQTRRQSVKAALAPLEGKNARLVGAILNKRAFALPQMIYERV